MAETRAETRQRVLEQQETWLLLGMLVGAVIGGPNGKPCTVTPMDWKWAQKRAHDIWADTAD